MTFGNYSWLNFRASGSLSKDWSAFIGLVPHVENWNTCFARVADHPDSVCDSRVDAGQWQLASR